jgi:hypothetical protein
MSPPQTPTAFAAMQEAAASSPSAVRKRETRTRLEQLVAERDGLRGRLDVNRGELQVAVREARESGWGMTNISRDLGLTRRAVYDLLGRPR